MNLHPNNARTSIVNGAVVCEPRRKNVAIVGFGPTSRHISRLQDDPDWEIWGLNDGYKNRCFWDSYLQTEQVGAGPLTLDLDKQSARLRVDRWFELHPMRVQPVDDVAWLARCPVPVYLLHPLAESQSNARNYPKSPAYAPESLPDMPNAVTYPIAQLEAAIRMPRPFWASTFAYQIALAISEGFEGIGLFGLDFGSEREVLFERANALWWAGVAFGRGINILVPPDSTFLLHGDGHRYGYQYDEEVAWCNTWIERYHGWWKVEKTREAVPA